jgi:hypothetical protein
MSCLECCDLREIIKRQKEEIDLKDFVLQDGDSAKTIARLQQENSTLRKNMIDLHNTIMESSDLS